MDLKYKGIGWVGGIYQKFETLCHEVDNIVNQDTVKYVENQAQSVGKSMKRFYSDVIHDILPPLKHEGQGVALKESATIDTYVKSKAAIEEDHIDTVGRLSNVEPVADVPFEKQLDHASKELLSVQLSTPTSVDAFEGAESDIMSVQVTDVLENTSSDVSIEENAITEKISASEVLELISPSEEESFGASLASEFIDSNNKNSFGFVDEVSLTMSVHDMEFQSHQKEGTVSNNIAVDVVKKQYDCAFRELCLVDQLGNPNSVHSLLGTEYVPSKQVADALKDAKPAVNIEENVMMEKPLASEMPELISPAEKESIGAILLSEDIDCNDKEPCWVESKVSSATSVHDVTKPSGSDVLSGITSPATLVHGDQNVRTVKNDFSDYSGCVSDASGGITSSKMTSPVILCEENMAKVEVDSSSGSVFKKYYLPENSPEKSPAKALLYHDSSPVLSALLSNEKKLKGPVPISSSNALSSESLAPIDDSTDDISISSMETIALCDEVKLEDSCVIVDTTALYAVSRIMKKHRSYKKRIQDALTSKKRLAKEYKQLAIWFGDADMESNNDNLQTLRPSSSSTTLECKNLQTELICDSEWELL
ncbi:uncharacterized protein LOC111301720 isoform X2 [Durio zibethinus]|uniref:Uncharacterized protein LOC111301720 isoform X2 n=1 Tax=Durio zibethinus TaxID=66656 RepID=A0A6P5ZM03_DURZI|nr:uncharacterized protein LOC111301720 isoform X2 [Durio zibethinus]